MTITETKRFDADAVRTLCIENQWYTIGTNSDYSAMFDMIDNFNHCETITNDHIAIIATDILKHSNPVDFTDNKYDDIATIMFYLNRKAVNTFYNISNN